MKSMDELLIEALMRSMPGKHKNQMDFANELARETGMKLLASTDSPELVLASFLSVSVSLIDALMSSVEGRKERTRIAENIINSVRNIAEKPYDKNN